MARNIVNQQGLPGDPGAPATPDQGSASSSSTSSPSTDLILFMLESAAPGPSAGNAYSVGASGTDTSA